MIYLRDWQQMLDQTHDQNKDYLDPEKMILLYSSPALFKSLQLHKLTNSDTNPCYSFLDRRKGLIQKTLFNKRFPLPSEDNNSF